MTTDCDKVLLATLLEVIVLVQLWAAWRYDPSTEKFWFISEAEIGLPEVNIFGTPTAAKALQSINLKKADEPAIL